MSDRTGQKLADWWWNEQLQLLLTVLAEYGHEKLSAVDSGVVVQRLHAARIPAARSPVFRGRDSRVEQIVRRAAAAGARRPGHVLIFEESRLNKPALHTTAFHPQP